MPAKEQTQTEIQEASQHEDSVSHQNSPSGLIHKIYDVVLSRDSVKNSMNRIKKTYHDVIVESRQQIDGIKRKGEEVYFGARERVKTWCYSITIYNHFTSLWLVKNLPFNSQKVVSFDDFLASFQNISKDTSQESEDLVRSFYKQASDVWTKLVDPELDEIKQACLLITARSIAIDFKIEVDGFSSALVELFATLDTKKHEIISNEAFYVQIRRKIATKLPYEIDFKRATETFYTFAKRFAYLEFPLTYANQDILKVLIKFAQEKLDILGEVFLGRIDSVLNVVIKRLGYVYEEKEDTITLLDRYHSILDKMMLITNKSYTRTKLAIQESKTYQFADKHIHFDDRYNDMVHISQYLYSTAANVISPIHNAITFTYDKVTREYVFVLYDVSSTLVKESYNNLKKRYAILKDATLRLRDNVLEIKFSKETFENLKADAKMNISLIYAEIRSMDVKKLKVYGGQAYKKAMEMIKGGAKAIESEKTETETEAKKEQ